MNNDLNHATRRLLQVILDMLINPAFDELDAEGKRSYGVMRYRSEQPCVEAAYRAAKEAQQMLAEAMPPLDMKWDTRTGEGKVIA